MTTTIPSLEGLNKLDSFIQSLQEERKNQGEVTKQLKDLNANLSKSLKADTFKIGALQQGGASSFVDQPGQFKTLGVRAREAKESMKDFFTVRGFLDKTGIAKRGAGGLLSEHLDRAEFREKGFVGAGERKDEDLLQPNSFAGWQKKDEDLSTTNFRGSSEETQQEQQRSIDEQTKRLVNIDENTAAMAKAIGALDESIKNSAKNAPEENGGGLLDSARDLLGLGRGKATPKPNRTPTSKSGRGVFGRMGDAIKRGSGAVLQTGKSIATTVGTVGTSIAESGVLSKAGKFVKGAAGGIGGLLGGVALDYGADKAEEAGHMKTSGALSAGSSALTGAGIGATIGSVIPVVGTAIGGAVGGLAGGAYGLWKNRQKLFGASKDQDSKTEGVYDVVGTDGKRYPVNNLDEVKQLIKDKKAPRSEYKAAELYFRNHPEKPSNVKPTVAPAVVKEDMQSLGEQTGEFANSVENVSPSSSVTPVPAPSPAPASSSSSSDEIKDKKAQLSVAIKRGDMKAVSRLNKELSGLEAQQMRAKMSPAAAPSSGSSVTQGSKEVTNAADKRDASRQGTNGAPVTVVNNNTSNNGTTVAPPLPVRKYDESLNRYTGSRLAY